MNIHALVLCGDQWHPAETVRRGLETLKSVNIDFVFLDDGSQWSAKKMKDFQIVVVAKANHICPTNQTPWLTVHTQWAFRDFVLGGGGLLLLHAGTSYEDLPVMRGVAGGALLRHPDQCPVVVEPVAGHPVSSGVTVFVEEDEHYQMAQDDVHAKVFLVTRSAHGIQPAGWTRNEGSGQVCVLTPGHNPRVWANVEFQKLLGRALLWTARFELK
jgi:uncharacterized protein